MVLITTSRNKGQLPGQRSGRKRNYLRTPTAPGSSIRERGNSIGYPNQRLVKARSKCPCATSRISEGFSPCILSFWIARISWMRLSRRSVTCCADLYWLVRYNDRRLDIIRKSFSLKKTYSPFSQPSLQISHSLSVSRPCSFLKARISLVNRPSYKP